MLAKCCTSCVLLPVFNVLWNRSIPCKLFFDTKIIWMPHLINKFWFVSKCQHMSSCLNTQIKTFVCKFSGVNYTIIYKVTWCIYVQSRKSKNKKLISFVHSRTIYMWSLLIHCIPHNTYSTIYKTTETLLCWDWCRTFCSCNKSPKGVTTTIMHFYVAQQKIHLNRLQAISKYCVLHCCISACSEAILVQFCPCNVTLSWFYHEKNWHLDQLT